VGTDAATAGATVATDGADANAAVVVGEGKSENQENQVK
jgi:hypothetical protein